MKSYKEKTEKDGEKYGTIIYGTINSLGIQRLKWENCVNRDEKLVEPVNKNKLQRTVIADNMYI